MRIYRLLLAVLFTVPVIGTFAQEKSPVKFGKISPADFDLSRFSFDSTADAVIIADIGSSDFEGTNKGLVLVFKHQMRIKILNKNGFDAANVSIPLYFDGRAEEELETLKAYTYNLENGKVVETKLAGNAVFKDKISEHKVVKKFTFPAVKEGSIVEYSYSVRSDFMFNLQPWSFQGEYPRIWSEYDVSIPQFFRYVFLAQGYHPFCINKTTTSTDHYNIGINSASADRGETINVSTTIINTHWAMKNVPALKEESFTSTIENHNSKIQFQFAEYLHPLEPKKVLGDWLSANEELMASEEFGASLNGKNNWLDDDMKALVAGSSSPLEKAKAIYAYVRDNFTTTGYGQRLSTPLKAVFKKKSGTVADINLLLIAMLRHENIEADPVLLSTRDHGFTNEYYPLISQYNYVIAETRIGKDDYYLDAAHSLGFNKLAQFCYNGHARVFGKQPRPVYFDSDSLLERKNTMVFMSAADHGWAGRTQSLLGYYGSVNLREKVRSKGSAEFFKSLSASNADLAMHDEGIDSLKLLDQPVKLHYDFEIKNGEDIVYFNPLMTEAYHENPFKAAERKYPVEMPYAIDETFILNMEVPKDYSVEELPKSAKVALNESEGSFEYIVQNDGNRIQVLSRVKLKKAYFLPEDYASLRDFFGYVVKKHSEQIVFKKKKA